MQKTQQEIRITARTVDQALEEAASRLKLSKEQLNYRVISQTSGGFFSFFGKKVEIAVKTGAGNGRAPQERAQRPKPARAEKPARVEKAAETVAEQEELTEAEVKALVEDLRSFCEEICRLMSSEARVEARVDDNRLVLDVNDEFLVAQITKNPKLAESLEHILRKKPRHLKRELPFRIFVDAQGLRMQREKELIDMAHDLSEKVHANKRPIVLNYKSSYDRKIIHMALDKDERVYTKSIGSGSNRKLMILPVKKGDGAEDFT